MSREEMMMRHCSISFCRPSGRAKVKFYSPMANAKCLQLFDIAAKRGVELSACLLWIFEFAIKKLNK